MYLRTELYELMRSDEGIFDFIQNGSPDGLWYWDLENPENEWMNARFWTVLGYNPDEMPHKSSAWQNIINQDDLQIAKDNFAKHCQNPDHPYDQIVRYTHKNGSTKWIRCRGLAIRDTAGKPIRMIGAHLDVSDIKNSEEAHLKAVEHAKESEARYHLIASNTSDSIWVMDADLRFTYLSPSTEKLFGYSLSDWETLNWNSFVKPDYMETVLNVFGDLKSGNKEVANPLSVIVRHKNGAEMWVEFSVNPLYDDNNVFTGVVGITRDITERKLAEEKEKELLKRFELIGQHLPGVIYQFRLRSDGSSHFPYASPGIYKIYGVQPKDVEQDATAVFNALHPDDIEQVRTSINHSAQTLTPWHDVYRVNLPTGKTIWVEGNSTPQKLEDGSTIWHGFIQDITERTQAEQKIIESKDKAEESEEKFRLLHENAGLGIGYYSSDGIVLSFNQIAAKHMNGNPEDFIGKSLFDLFTKENADFYFKRMQNAIISSQPMVYEDLIQLPTEDKWFISTYTKIENSQQKFLGIQIISQDVTKLKTTEIELQKAKEKAEESETQFRNLFESAADAIFIADNETGLIIDANQAAERLTQMERAEIIGMHQTKLHPPGAINYSNDSFRQHQKLTEEQKLTSPIEINVVRKDGAEVPVEVLAFKVNYKGKKCLAGNFRDITERKHAEDALRESEGKFSKAFQTSPYAIIITRAEDGGFIDVNNAFTLIAGYTREEALTNSSVGLKLWASEEDRKSVIADLRAGRAVEGREYQFRTKCGKKITGLFSAQIIKLSSGLSILSSINDITERKLSEEKIREKDLQFRKLSANLPDLIYQFTRKPDGTYCVPVSSEGIKNIFGCSPEDVIDDFAPISRVIFPEDSERVIHDIEYSAEHLTYFTCEFRVQIPGKPIQWILSRSTPEKLPDGSITWYGFNADLTERKQAERLLMEKSEVIAVQNEELNQKNKELVAAKERAEESDRLKSAFLANMSHEIRTPMNGILGFADLLKEPGLSGEQQQAYIKIIEKSGIRMLNIINDIVDISKVEAGLMKPDIQESNINGQIEYIYTFFKPEAEAKGIKLSFRNTLPAREAIIQTDREKLYAILTNLVKNAIKFTHGGMIELGYNVAETLHATSLLHFYVKDTGIGIPKGKQEAIFERFIQADIADTMARQGAGLGLAISKAYIEMLGGKIWVDSEEGKGSTFYFTLPYNAEPDAETGDHQPAPAEKSEDVKKLKILIAEDDEVSEMLIDSYIKTYGKEITKARTGVEAVEAIRNEPDFDLVLMDVRMPEMGGYEATRQIREFNKEVVIIAQTAYAQSGDREKAMQAGCSDYISKPIQKNELRALMQKHFGK